MTSSPGFTLLLIAILMALVADILITWRLRRYYQPRHSGEENQTLKVYLLSGFSSLLTRLKSRRAVPLPVEPPDGNAALVQDEDNDITILEVMKGRMRSLSGGWDLANPLIRLPAIGEGQWRLIEWGLIVIAVLSFCAGFLHFNLTASLPGNEAEVFQTLDWTLVNSLSHYGQFPLWNPYLETGLPYLGDPMTHVFNPLVTIPVLLYGVQTGFKMALFLSFLAAAFGMWRLGTVLGMGHASRVWIALLYVFAGQPAARFFQGQYLFVLGFAWIPWCIGSLYLLYKTGRRFHIATSAIALALIFFSGNAYYAFYMLVTVGLLALVLLPQLKHREKPFRLQFRLDTRFLVNLSITAILTLGIVAIQLLPMIEFWPRLSKSNSLIGVQTPLQVLWDYTSKNTQRPDVANPPITREEFYAYIGMWPILALTLLPLALWKRERRPILFLLLLLLFAFVWIDVRNLPWNDFLIKSDLFQQFRQLLRILVYGGFAIILLAGLSLDTLWKILQPAQAVSASPTGDRLGYYLSLAGMAALLFSFVVTAADVYRANQPILTTENYDRKVDAAMGWLRQVDLLFTMFATTRTIRSMRLSSPTICSSLMHGITLPISAGLKDRSTSSQYRVMPITLSNLHHPRRLKSPTRSFSKWMTTSSTA